MCEFHGHLVDLGLELHVLLHDGLDPPQLLDLPLQRPVPREQLLVVNAQLRHLLGQLVARALAVICGRETFLLGRVGGRVGGWAGELRGLMGGLEGGLGQLRGLEDGLGQLKGLVGGLGQVDGLVGGLEVVGYIEGCWGWVGAIRGLKSGRWGN